MLQYKNISVCNGSQYQLYLQLAVLAVQSVSEATEVFVFFIKVVQPATIKEWTYFSLT